MLERLEVLNSAPHFPGEKTEAQRPSCPQEPSCASCLVCSGSAPWFGPVPAHPGWSPGVNASALLLLPSRTSGLLPHLIPL